MDDQSFNETNFGISFNETNFRISFFYETNFRISFNETNFGIAQAGAYRVAVFFIIQGSAKVFC